MPVSRPKDSSDYTGRILAGRPAHSHGFGLNPALGTEGVAELAVERGLIVCGSIADYRFVGRRKEAMIGAGFLELSGSLMTRHWDLLQEDRVAPSCPLISQGTHVVATESQ